MRPDILTPTPASARGEPVNQIRVLGPNDAVGVAVTCSLLVAVYAIQGVVAAQTWDLYDAGSAGEATEGNRLAYGAFNPGIPAIAIPDARPVLMLPVRSGKLWCVRSVNTIRLHIVYR